jgi:hypothetical protein
MNQQTSQLVKGLLSVVKQYIEYRFKKEVVSIEPEDGSGTGFIVVTRDNPLKKQYVKF